MKKGLAEYLDMSGDGFQELMTASGHADRDRDECDPG